MVKIDNEILIATLGIMGVLVNQPLILSIFIYFVSLYAIFKFFRYDNDIFLITIGLLIPFLLGAYSYSLPERIQFVLLYVPIITGAYFLFTFIPTETISKILMKFKKSNSESFVEDHEQKIRKTVKNIIQPLISIIAVFFLVVGTVLSIPIFRQITNTTIIEIIGSFVISALHLQAFQNMLLEYVVITVLYILIIYFLLLWKDKIKIQKRGIMISAVIIFFVLLAYNLFLLFVQPQFFPVYGLNMDSLIKSNLITCRLNETSLKVAFYNPFDSSICEVKIYNSTNTLSLDIVVPKNNIDKLIDIRQQNSTISIVLSCAGYSLSPYNVTSNC